MKNLLKSAIFSTLFLFAPFHLSAYNIYLITGKTNPGITVTSPNGGENLLADSTYNITWTSYMTSGTLKINYSINNGQNWTEITAGTPDDGIYEWTVPDTPSDSCLICISDSTPVALSDTSDAVFIISSSSGILKDGLPEVYSLDVIVIATSNKLEFIYTLPEKADDIKFVVYNLVGRKIKEKVLKESPAGYYLGNIDISGISKGLYFIRMEVNRGKFTQTRKFLLM